MPIEKHLFMIKLLKIKVLITLQKMIEKNENLAKIKNVKIFGFCTEITIRGVVTKRLVVRYIP